MDTREWREYRIGDIFDIKSCKCQDANELEEGKDTFYIGAKKDLLGIMKNVAKEEDLMIDGNCIVFICQGQGSVGYANYVPCDFIGATSLRVGYHKKLNKFNWMFIATILDLQRPRFSFGRGWGNTLKDTIINLPTTHDNQPDWQFMEDYIKKIYNKVIEEVKASAPALLSLSLSLKNRPVLKCDEWKEFRVGELFDVVLSSGDLKLEECEVGKMPLISSGETNNGIVGYITKGDKDKSQIFNNCITIDMFCHAYYQPFNFYAVSHGRVNILIPKQEMSKFVCLFICAILNNEEYRFNYGRAVYSSTAQNITINLPTTPQGEPDWEWMERYVKRIFG